MKTMNKEDCLLQVAFVSLKRNTNVLFLKQGASKEYEDIELLALDSTGHCQVVRTSKRLNKMTSKAAPPSRMLPLALIKKVVMETLGSIDVDKMYGKIKSYMKDEEKKAKKKVFGDMRTMNKEDCVRSVAKFLMGLDQVIHKSNL